MSLLAAVIGAGIISLISLDFFFRLPEEKILYKAIFFTVALFNLLAISYMLFAGSQIASTGLSALTGFFENHLYFSLVMILLASFIFMKDIVLWGVSLLKNGKE